MTLGVVQSPRYGTSITHGSARECDDTQGGVQGKNDFGNLGYGGPSPPKGKPHRYFFKVYALDTVLELGEGITKDRLEQAMKGHVLSQRTSYGRIWPIKSERVAPVAMPSVARLPGKKIVTDAGFGTLIAGLCS